MKVPLSRSALAIVPVTRRLLVVALGATLLAAACGTSASDVDTSPDSNAAAATNSTTGVGAAAQAARRPAATPAKPRGPSFREVTIPAGTALVLRLTTAVASDTSRVEDSVSAELTEPVRIDGREVLPAGASVRGVVTDADESGRVKGRASLAFEFTSLDTGGARYEMRTEPVSRLASATKGEDAVKIGIGAGAGAVIGGILGWKKGAAEGAAVGGGAGTGVVLATRGQEVRLAPGANVSTQLRAPLTVRVGMSQ